MPNLKKKKQHVTIDQMELSLWIRHVRYIFALLLTAEVLEAKRHADREELNKLKEQLLISFKDQMELRKSLMELNNATMEISLETNRNQLVISE